MIAVLVVAGLGPRHVWEARIELPLGATVADALAASQAVDRFAVADRPLIALSVWSEPVGPEQVLKDGDRLELNRPLRVDPKTARRERFAKQGARTTGLFAKLRPGGKKGY